MGGHGEALPEVDHHKSGELSSTDFYMKYLAANVPVIIDGEAAAATQHVEWDDDFFLDRCKLPCPPGLNCANAPHMAKWFTLVEFNKV